MFKKIAQWYNKQSSSIKAMILIGIIAIIGIIIRWNQIIEGIQKGFNFYNN